MDYSAILQMVSAYLVWAKELFWTKKNIYDVALIPAWHHMYTGMLKAAWYALLKQSNTLFLISKWKWDKISVFDWDYPIFMWKEIKVDAEIINILKKSRSVKLSKTGFEWYMSEFQFLRVIWEYDYVICIEIWNDIQKTAVVNLLSKLMKFGNLMFVSDFHSGLSVDECVDLDSIVFEPWCLDTKPELFLINIFYLLSLKSKKILETVWYINSADISGDTKDTTGFGCVVF